MWHYGPLDAVDLKRMQTEPLRFHSDRAEHCMNTVKNDQIIIKETLPSSLGEESLNNEKEIRHFPQFCNYVSYWE